MSVEAVEKVLRRARDEPEFGDQLRRSPEEALHGYDVEYSERQALISGDAAKLRDLGVAPDLSLLADAYNPTQQEPTQ